MICYKLNIWVLRGAVNREGSLAKMRIKWQKKNSAWSRYSIRRKQTTIDQGLVSSSAQAQLHQAPLNGLENDLIYQVTCTYNIRLLNGCRARVREMREQRMMGRRERPLISHPSLHLSFKKRAIVCSFLFLYKYTLFNRWSCKSLEKKKKCFPGVEYPGPRVFLRLRDRNPIFGLALSQTEKFKQLEPE